MRKAWGRIHFPRGLNHWLYRMKLCYKCQPSCGKFRGKPATRWIDWSFATMPNSEERFARQNPSRLPPVFPLASSWPGIVHHLSGPNMYALGSCVPCGYYKTRVCAPFWGDLPVTLITPFWVNPIRTCIHVRLLGPCFKTGRSRLRPGVDCWSTEAWGRLIVRTLGKVRRH